MNKQFQQVIFGHSHHLQHGIELSFLLQCNITSIYNLGIKIV